MENIKNLAVLELDVVEMAMLSGGDEPPTTPTPPTPNATLPTASWGTTPANGGSPNASGAWGPNNTVSVSNPVPPTVGGGSNPMMPRGLQLLLDSLSNTQ
jgi:hypothetical protein